jgi:hypothetical protein
MDATKIFTQSQTPISPKSSRHKPKDAIDDHMGTQLIELNETIYWILRVKKISKMFKDHAKKDHQPTSEMCKKVDLKESTESSRSESS